MSSDLGLLRNALESQDEGTLLDLINRFDGRIPLSMVTEMMKHTSAFSLLISFDGVYISESVPKTM